MLNVNVYIIGSSFFISIKLCLSRVCAYQIVNTIFENESQFLISNLRAARRSDCARREMGQDVLQSKIRRHANFRLCNVSRYIVSFYFFGCLGGLYYPIPILSFCFFSCLVTQLSYWRFKLVIQHFKFY